VGVGITREVVAVERDILQILFELIVFLRRSCELRIALCAPLCYFGRMNGCLRGIATLAG
jgi:hypothetical protein